ncbi:protein arginine methyltransferase NDUFAF7, mitochondrial-like [Halichondria panicea]|uniref:protein arginine methyltransferase NDUFAF7, mitochondrial-like n=1 Tax=Halichondria panicea TaxID=6063 RepID=UPI00312B7410
MQAVRRLSTFSLCSKIAAHCQCRSSCSSTERDLYEKLKFSGPISVANYMQYGLTHPSHGYYMKRDVFGSHGDFITSPEISQVFGELLAVWMLADWKGAGEPGNCQLVELGPGRGTLIKDMLRVFSHERLKSILNGLTIHLVEASLALSSIQQQTLTESPASTPPPNDAPPSNPYQSCRLEAHGGVEVHWYKKLEDVPRGFSYFFAHEFLDALPIHQFQKTPSGWREVLVDIDPSSEGRLRFVVAPGPTVASTAYASLLPPTHECEWCEVCPEGLVTVKEMAQRIREVGGGAALIADYGEDGTKKNTLRGFKNHQLHDALESPGSADLTADVDFAAVRRAALSEEVGCHGPITQNEFLHKLGIRQRLEVLMRGANPSQARDIVSSYEMLTSPEKMGHRFKFMSLTAHPQLVPVPFFNDVTIIEQ